MKARIVTASKNLVTDKLQVTFEIDGRDGMEMYEKYKEADVDIKVSKYSPKKSDQARKYAWELLGAIGMVQKISSIEVYEQILKNHPLFMYDNDGNVIMIRLNDSIPAKVLVNDTFRHWMPLRTDDGFTIYAAIKGISQLNKKEMSWLIDSIVEIAKENDIETMTPQEIEILKGYLKEKKK